MMEAVGYSEMSVSIYQNTWHNVPKEPFLVLNSAMSVGLFEHSVIPFDTCITTFLRTLS